MIVINHQRCPPTRQPTRHCPLEMHFLSRFKVLKTPLTVKVIMMIKLSVLNDISDGKEGPRGWGGLVGWVGSRCWKSRANPSSSITTIGYFRNILYQELSSLTTIGYLFSKWRRNVYTKSWSLVFSRVWFLLCSHIFVLFDILLVSGRRRRPPVTINPRVLCFPAINGIICGFWAVVWAGRQKSPPFTRQMNWPSIHKRLNCLCKLLFGRRQGNLKGKKANFDMLAGWGKFHFHCICILECRQ